MRVRWVVELTPRAGLQPRARKPPKRVRAEARSLGRMIETRRAGPHSPAGVISLFLLARVVATGGVGRGLRVQTGLSRLWRRADSRRSDARAPDAGGNIGWKHSRLGSSISRPNSKGFSMPSIARRSSKPSTPESSQANNTRAVGAWPQSGGSHARAVMTASLGTPARPSWPRTARPARAPPGCRSGSTRRRPMPSAEQLGAAGQRPPRGPQQQDPPDQPPQLRLPLRRRASRPRLPPLHRHRHRATAMNFTHNSTGAPS